MSMSTRAIAFCFQLGIASNLRKDIEAGAAFDVCILVGDLEALAKRLPAGDLLLAPSRVLVERDVEALDEVRPVALDEPRRVLREVLTALGDEVAEAAEHLVANTVGHGDAAHRTLRIGIGRR